MRTTIEMRPEHRSSLLAIAARRGEKGFSALVAEAIEQYLRGEHARGARRRELLSLAGSLPQKDAADLRETARELRENWR